MTDMTLKDLGWNAHFAAEVQDGDTALRVSEVHRTGVSALGPDGTVSLRAPEGSGDIAVGDWVTAHEGAVARVLERHRRGVRDAKDVLWHIHVLDRFTRRWGGTL